MHFSCSESVAKNGKFKNPALGINEWTPYADWTKHYPGWKLPTEVKQGTLHVREYIFAHYQEELVKYLSGNLPTEERLKVCTKIPPRFWLHDIGALRLEQEYIIGL